MKDVKPYVKTMLRNEVKKYKAIISGLLTICISLFLLLACSIYIHIRTIEEMAVITVGITELGEENLELKNDLEYYERCLQKVTKYNKELRKELDSAYEDIMVLERDLEEAK